MQTVEIGDFVRPDITAFRVTRTIRGKLYQVVKPYPDIALTGMLVEDVAKVIQLDIENEFARNLPKQRIFNGYPTTDEAEQVLALIQTAIGFFPRMEDVTDGKD